MKAGCEELCWEVSGKGALGIGFGGRWGRCMHEIAAVLLVPRNDFSHSLHFFPTIH